MIGWKLSCEAYKGVQADTYGTFLTPIIMGKLPSDLRLISSRHLGEQWNLDSLLKEFGVELQLREKCVLGAGQEEQSATFRKSSRNQHFTASSLIAEVEKGLQHFAGACVSDYRCESKHVVHVLQWRPLVGKMCCCYGSCCGKENFTTEG